MRYPPLPRVVDAPGGKVTILQKVDVRAGENEPAYGSWAENTRTVEVDSRETLVHRWRTLFHELTHVALTDAGVDELFTTEAVEAICDAVATARLRERFG